MKIPIHNITNDLILYILVLYGSVTQNTTYAFLSRSIFQILDRPFSQRYIFVQNHNFESYFVIMRILENTK